MKILLGFMTALLVLGCGKARDAVVQSFNEPALMSTWETKCNKSSILDLSERTFLTFAGSEFQKVQEFYNNDDCKDVAALVRYRGSFLLNNSTIPENGAKYVDYKYEEAKVTAKNEDGRKALEKVGLCGHETWKVDQEVDLTSQSAGKACPLRTAPSVAYEVYKVQGDGNSKSLLVSKIGWLSSRAETASDRAKELDSKNPLSLSQHKF